MRNAKKIEYTIFIILFYLQNFALIKTSSFGVNGMVCFLALISILNFKKYYCHMNKNKLLIIVVAIIYILANALFNETVYITQILRYMMIFWMIFMGTTYIEEIFQTGKEKVFFKIYVRVFLIFLIYGIYEYIADTFRLPLYLNIFANNPSYGERDFSYYYGGWIGKPRLYNSFFEPSIFSTFLVYNFFLVKEMKGIPPLNKILIYALTLFNFVFTYARTGYIIFVYMICIYILYQYILTEKKNVILVDILVLALPFINLFVMYYVGLALFSDLSSLARTYSGMYYLFQSFVDLPSFFLGHSIGSIMNSNILVKYVEHQAHNGYVDVLYQNGFVILMFFIGFLYRKLKNIKKNKYLLIGVLATFCCFGIYFAIETLVMQIIIIYYFCKYSNREEKE